MKSLLHWLNDRERALPLAAALLLLLAGQWFGGCATKAPGNSNWTVTVVDADSGAALPNVWVQLDNTLLHSGITNAAGQITFNNAGGAAHDVHLFANGYRWHSRFLADPANLTFALHKLVPTASFLTFSGTATNVAATASTLQLKLTAAGRTYSAAAVVNPLTGAFTAAMPLSGIAPGTAVNGTLAILELAAAVNLDLYAVDLYTLPAAAYTTQNAPALAPIPTNFAFAAAVPAPTALASLTSLAAPTGIAVASARLSAPDGTDLWQRLAAPFAGAIAAYTPDPAILNYTLSAGDLLGRWQRSSSFPVGSAKAVATMVAGLPSVTAGQIGSPISVTPAVPVAGIQTSALMQRVEILATYLGVPLTPLWTLEAPGNVVGYTLPTPPVVAVPLLSPGAACQLRATTTLTVGSERESITSPAVAYTY